MTTPPPPRVHSTLPVTESFRLLGLVFLAEDKATKAYILLQILVNTQGPWPQPAADSLSRHRSLGSEMAALVSGACPILSQPVCPFFRPGSCTCEPSAACAVAHSQAAAVQGNSKATVLLQEKAFDRGLSFPPLVQRGSHAGGKETVVCVSACALGFLCSLHPDGPLLNASFTHE